MIYKLKFYTFLFSALLLVLVISCKDNHSSDPKTNDKSYIVMLSLDGFRWDHPQKANTPNLDRIAKIMCIKPANVDGNIYHVSGMLTNK